jgi:hypothetical protein
VKGDRYQYNHRIGMVEMDKVVSKKKMLAFLNADQGWVATVNPTFIIKLN